MNKLERAALEHAQEELGYRRSPQAKRNALADKIRREAADKAAGHLPSCSLTRCNVDCPKVRA